MYFEQTRGFQGSDGHCSFSWLHCSFGTLTEGNKLIADLCRDTRFHFHQPHLICEDFPNSKNVDAQEKEILPGGALLSCLFHCCSLREEGWTCLWYTYTETTRAERSWARAQGGSQWKAGMSFPSSPLHASLGGTGPSVALTAHEWCAGGDCHLVGDQTRERWSIQSEQPYR